jgi:hypothetical protein
MTDEKRGGGRRPKPVIPSAKAVEKVREISTYRAEVAARARTKAADLDEFGLPLQRLADLRPSEIIEEEARSLLRAAVDRACRVLGNETTVDELRHWLRVLETVPTRSPGARAGARHPEIDGALIAEYDRRALNVSAEDQRRIPTLLARDIVAGEGDWAGEMRDQLRKIGVGGENSIGSRIRRAAEGRKQVDEDEQFVQRQLGRSILDRTMDE